jgi:hypothetical protein
MIRLKTSVVMPGIVTGAPKNSALADQRRFLTECWRGFRHVALQKQGLADSPGVV